MLPFTLTTTQLDAEPDALAEACPVPLPLVVIETLDLELVAVLIVAPVLTDVRSLVGRYATSDV